MNADNQAMFDKGYAMSRYKRPVREASTFFKQTPKGYVIAYRNIGHYLVNMAVYQDTGDERYRAIAIRVFGSLPQYAKKRMHELGLIVHSMHNPASADFKPTYAEQGYDYHGAHGYHPSNPKIELFIDGQYYATTQWFKKVKDAVKSVYRVLWNNDQTGQAMKKKFGISVKQLGQEYVLVNSKGKEIKITGTKMKRNPPKQGPHMPNQRWRLYSYDVWGNARDGYEVNQVFYTDEYYEINPGWTDARLISELKKQGLLKKTVRAASIEMDGDDQVIYFSYRGRPEFELRKVG